ncbi:MAG: type I restriction-modification system subunit M, partial [Bdellovibrionota bacterium]
RPAEKNARLRDLINLFHDIDLRPSVVGTQDIVGNSYEYLIARFAEDAGQKGGEFYTPAGVAQLLAEVVDPKDGETIYDPTCGSGSLLIRTANLVKSKNYSIYGQESNASTWALCKMNMFLHGIDNANVERGDTIRGPIFLEGNSVKKFNKVVANPPFSLDKWGLEEAQVDPYGRFKKRDLPPKSKGDFAFIIHMVESLLERGTAAVVVPHGVLFRGASEGKIRESFVKENLIDSVIGLPSNLFYGTGIAAAVIVLKKGRKHKDILFIDASHDFEPGKRQNKLRIEGENADIPRIIECYKKRKVINKYSALISLDEIKANEFNLNISRYVDSSDEEVEIDIHAIQKEIATLEKRLDDTRKEMKKYLKELGLNG